MSRTDKPNREHIAEILRSEKFANFIARSHHWRKHSSPRTMPVAVLSAADAKVLGLRGARVVRLSAETAAVKALKHGNTAADWRQLQVIMDGAEKKFYKPPFALLFYRKLRWWRGGWKYRLAVVKRTRDGRELYVTTMHWMREKEIRRGIIGRLKMLE